jgi:hypothetical protein
MIFLKSSALSQQVEYTKKVLTKRRYIRNDLSNLQLNSFVRQCRNLLQTAHKSGFYHVLC